MRKCLILLVAILLVAVATSANAATRNAPTRGAPMIITQGTVNNFATEPTALGATNDAMITPATETANEKILAQLFVEPRTEVTSAMRAQEEGATPPPLIEKTENVRPVLMLTGRVALNFQQGPTGKANDSLAAINIDVAQSRATPEVVDLRRQQFADQSTKAMA